MMNLVVNNNDGGLFHDDQDEHHHHQQHQQQHQSSTGGSSSTSMKNELLCGVDVVDKTDAQQQEQQQQQQQWIWDGGNYNNYYNEQIVVDEMSAECCSPRDMLSADLELLPLHQHQNQEQEDHHHHYDKCGGVETDMFLPVLDRFLEHHNGNNNNNNNNNSNNDRSSSSYSADDHHLSHNDTTIGVESINAPHSQQHVCEKVSMFKSDPDLSSTNNGFLSVSSTPKKYVADNDATAALGKQERLLNQHSPKRRYSTVTSPLRALVFPTSYAESIKNQTITTTSAKSNFGTEKRLSLSKSCVNTSTRNNSSTATTSAPTTTKKGAKNNGNSKSTSTTNTTTKKRRQTKKKQQDIATATTTEETQKVFVSDPTEFDVLLGRGTRSNNHSGNKRYREELEKLKSYYRSIPKRDDKTDLSQKFVDHIRESYGGRFLKMDPSTNQWYEVPNIVARKKVCHALREDNTPEIRAKKRRMYNYNTNNNHKNKDRSSSSNNTTTTKKSNIKIASSSKRRKTTITNK